MQGWHYSRGLIYYRPLYLRIAWTSAFKQFFGLVSHVYNASIFRLKTMNPSVFCSQHLLCTGGHLGFICTDQVTEGAKMVALNAKRSISKNTEK